MTRQTDQSPFDYAVLEHDERHLRRKTLTLSGGETILVDLPEAVMLAHGDRLVLDDGRQVEVRAADEELLEVRTSDARTLSVLAWHIGNRHLAAQIEADRILIGRDHVLRDMLRGLGASVRDIVEPFQPERGAYHGGHNHHHEHRDEGGANHHVHISTHSSRSHGAGGHQRVSSHSSTRVRIRSIDDNDR